METLLDESKVSLPYHLKSINKVNHLQMSYGQFTTLILTPTRELAVQIKSHIQVACRYTKFKVNLICCHCWWYVNTKTSTSFIPKAGNCCCNTRSILGIIRRSKKKFSFAFFLIFDCRKMNILWICLIFDFWLLMKLIE
jgi:hypothetical protein